MKKITYLLLFFISVSFAQTSGKVSFTAKIENRNSDTLTIYGPKKFKLDIPVNQKGIFQSSFEITEGLQLEFNYRQDQIMWKECTNHFNSRKYEPMRRRKKIDLFDFRL